MNQVEYSSEGNKIILIRHSLAPGGEIQQALKLMIVKHKEI